jgi:hypothetical protein
VYKVLGRNTKTGRSSGSSAQVIDGIERCSVTVRDDRDYPGKYRIIDGNGIRGVGILFRI